MCSRLGISLFVIQTSVLNSKANELQICVKDFLFLSSDEKYYFKGYLGR